MDIIIMYDTPALISGVIPVYSIRQIDYFSGLSRNLRVVQTGQYPGHKKNPKN
jgi:hypothetical protein